MRTIITNLDKLKSVKEKIKKGGIKNIHILSDFDRTLTYGSIKGEKTPSIIAMLRDGKHLTQDYAEKAHILFDKYHPIEIDRNISLKEKKAHMQRWWEDHNKILIESGLSRKDLEDIAKNGMIRFRDGVPDFLDLLKKNNIPLIILSASGCGDAIKMFFQKEDKDYSNIHYVTNQFNWDENEKAISAKEPIIHSLNKDETVLREIPSVFSAVKDRKNVILIGDSIDDLGMIEGFDYDNLIKIGFINFDYDENIGKFKKNFDIILEGSSNFDFINELLKEL